MSYQSKEEKLVRLYERFEDEGRLGEFDEALKGDFKTGAFKLENFDVGRLFEACFGWEEFRACRSDRSRSAVRVMENAGATMSTAFSNITKQFVYSTFMEPLQHEDYPFHQLIPAVPTEFNGERIPGVTRRGNDQREVGEADAYPLAGVGEDFIDTPPTKKMGVIVPVTREAIFFNRTGTVLLERLRIEAKQEAIDLEQKAIDAVIDENAGAVSKDNGGHRYHWRGTSIATYGDNSGSHTWDNLTASNALVDWTDIDAAEQTINTIVDPHTGLPTMPEMTHLVVTKQLEQTARRILSATEIRTGDITTGAGTQTIQGNPYSNKYRLLTTKLLASRLGTDTSWFLVNFMAWKRMVNWAPEVTQAPSNSHDEFHRDIVMQWKYSRRDAFTTVEPRLAHKSTA